MLVKIGDLILNTEQVVYARREAGRVTVSTTNMVCEYTGGACPEPIQLSGAEGEALWRHLCGEAIEVQVREPYRVPASDARVVADALVTQLARFE